MAEQYLKLGPGDRREVLEFAASESGRPAYLLEKDIWVVWALRTLFDSPMGAPLVFNGGTSLSKAYGAIRRFSEDVDLTYGIRALVPELVGDSPHPLPASGVGRSDGPARFASVLLHGLEMPLLRSWRRRCGQSRREERSGSKTPSFWSATRR